VAYTGEVRGEPEQPGMGALPSVSDTARGESPGGF